jgi:hypothetical protein
MSEARRAESNGGEGRIRTSEAAGATDLQSAAFDRFATSPIHMPPVTRSKKAKLRRGKLRAPHAMAARRAKLFGFSPFATSPAELPEIPCRARFIHLRASALRRTGGAGEGIRTPDRLITNQLLYRTELRQPRQKITCSTRRATRASEQGKREKGQGKRSFHFNDLARAQFFSLFPFPCPLSLLPFPFFVVVRLRTT